jgi:general secretion pathway protein G
VDPWGNPYQYKKFSNDQMRKDRFAQDVNTDYDLYSKGRDKLTQASLTAEESHDDVIRGNNGLYKGLASAF